MAEVVDKSYDILISNQDDTIIEKLRPLNLQYDSRVSECMEGTRQDIVSEIMDWTADTEAPNILWLKGYPGVGKSAIATTLVEKLRSIGRLGSSFFFKREIADAMTPRALCRKITYDLGRRYPAIRSHLVAALKANDDILSTSNVHHLFCQLIINPLTKSNDIPFKCLPVIIIDALDECRGFDGQRSYHRENLMQMLARWSHLPRRFKLMVTSRGESDICRLFQTTSHYLVEISTGQAVKPQSSSDIMAFLGHEFEKIADEYPNSLPSGWPGLDVIRRLTEMAGGLFVWVEVILKFIKQGDPHQRLGYILQGDVSGDLGTLYSSVLGISFPDPSDEELANFRAIMGTVILMKNPLPVSSLATLLSIQRSTMEYICNRLQSVMDCQDTLRVHHQSFVEFLLDQEACPNAFLIDRAIGHRNLTRACLQTMNSGLKFNTCGLKSSYIPNSEIHNLYSLVSHHISPHLLYSSYFWASHLKEAAFDKVVVSHLHRFMSEMFLFWLEVLSLTRGVNLASTMIRTLINWTRTCGQNIRMACDMERFVAAFANVILQSVPHIYLSALPLSPLTSIVREEYMKKLPRLLTIRHGGHVSWPAIIKVFTGHDDWITSVAFSPDNRLVVSGSWDNTVRIWDAETGELVTQPLEGHKDCVNSVAFSPDGRRVVSGSDDKTIRIWNIETGELIIEPFQGHESGISSVSFSPNGKRIVSGSWDKTVRIWDAEVGEIITRPLVGHKDGVNSVAFSLDGRRVVSGSNDQTVRIWDAETGHLVTKPLQGHKDIVTSVALSPNGRHLVSGSNDKTVQIWDTETGELVTPPLEGHEGGVTCVTFSSDGRRVVSGSNDRTIRIWDAETGQPVTRPLESHSDIVAFVAFSSDGRRIISGSWDKTVQVWNVETDELDTLTSDGHNDGVSSVAFSPDGRRIVSGSWDKTVRIWDTETGALVVEPLEGHRSSVTSVAFSPDGKRVASGSWDKTVRIWDIQMGQLVIQPLNGHKDYVTSVVFSPDSKSVVSGSHDKTIRIWDAETGELITYPLKGHEDYVTSVSFSPNGGRVASGSFDKTIRIWDTETGETVIQPLRGHKLGINLVAFSPDGRRVLSGSRDKTVRLWDAESGGLVAESSQWHECSLISVMFWPSGRCIVSGLNGKTVLIRDAETHEPVAQSLVGHEANVTSLALSPDGRSVVSGSWDNTVRVWDVETGDSRRNLPTHVSSSPDIDILSPNSPVLQIESNLEPNSMQEDGSTPLTTSSAYPHKATVIPSKSVSSIVENFHIEPDGWILGPQSELLLWVPPTLRVGLYRSRNKLIIGRCIKTWIDFDLFVHGNEWARCEEPRDD
ncbi:hypothetical protein M408DRAFT_308850 [Serendipita vermifera MAFF 305830]|uniref:Nephrocystin 3-like N-terminal domain-containing protein n=1 Tax=Serendipita vermifera MAFF 305830 TaxID=933852 RepID=A0A0C2W161_SERVB|nr:hypothetical protein M408DRAFT_308850 [Serendipita vermifera MAFF 305830]